MNLINKKKLLIPIFFFSFSFFIEVSASSLGIYVFEDYQNIYNLLKEKEEENPKASLILSNAKLYSIDYSPSSFTRTNRPNPSYPMRQSKDGIEGYAEVTFEINFAMSYFSNHSQTNWVPVFPLTKPLSGLDLHVYTISVYLLESFFKAL